MSRKITQIFRGAVLARESLAMRTSPPLSLEKIEFGNRAMRRVAAKQRKQEAKRK
jgi:hypothetical protein